MNNTVMFEEVSSISLGSWAGLRPLGKSRWVSLEMQKIEVLGRVELVWFRDRQRTRLWFDELQPPPVMKNDARSRQLAHQRRSNILGPKQSRWS